MAALTVVGAALGELGAAGVGEGITERFMAAVQLSLELPLMIWSFSL